MSLSKTYQPSIRLGQFELDGLLKVLERTISEKGENGEADTPYYVGALIALNIVRYHESIEHSGDFMRLFVKALDELEGGNE